MDLKKNLRKNFIIGVPYRAVSAMIKILRGIVLAWIPLISKDPQAIRFFPQWILSFNQTQAPFRKGEPWLTFEAIAWLSSYLTKEMIIFEWGSGGSTIFFAKKAKEIISVEHDSKWHKLVLQKMRQQKIINCHYVLQVPETGKGVYYSEVPLYRGFNFDKYCQTIDAYPADYFDLIFIDGRARVACAQKAIAKLKKGGFLMLDDSNTKEYLQVNDLLQKWPRKDFYGLKRGAITFYQTTIWQKPAL